jgi:hypothetical protein
MVDLVESSRPLALVDVSITLMSAESRVTADVVVHLAECNPFPVRCKPHNLEREGSSGTLVFDVFWYPPAACPAIADDS